MRSLEQSQLEFVNAILRRDFDSVENIIPGGKLTVEGAIKVYQRGYFARLTESLGETYEACWWTLGDERFFEICELYIENHPSTVDNLSHYGLEFPEFFKTLPELADFPFLVDLAQFELQFAALFHQKEEPSMTAEDIARDLTGVQDFKMGFTSNHFVFKSLFSINEIWKNRKTPVDQNLEVASKTTWDRPQVLLVSKKTELINISELPPNQAQLFSLLKTERTIREAITNLEGLGVQLSPSELQAIFQGISSGGLLKEIISISG